MISLLMILLACGEGSSSSSTTTSSSSKKEAPERDLKIPFMQAITMAEGCCRGGGGTWSNADERCVMGDEDAIAACIGKFTMVMSSGEEIKVTGRSFIRGY